MTLSSIRAGDRVTIFTPQGQHRHGTATLWNPVHQCWVCNAGGAYGTPILASEKNYVSHKPGRLSRSRAREYAILNGGVTP